MMHQSFDIGAGIRMGYLRQPNVLVPLEKNNLGKIQISDKLIIHIISRKSTFDLFSWKYCTIFFTL